VDRTLSSSATQPVLPPLIAEGHMPTVINEGGSIIYVDPQAGGATVSVPNEIYGFWLDG
jgi:hypothetical protein